MNYTPHLSAVCGELALASRSWKLCASETPVFNMKNTLLLKNTNFYSEIYTSGELSLVSWLWQVSGEAGSGDLARPSWLYEFLQKEHAKKCAPLCGEMR